VAERAPISEFAAGPGSGKGPPRKTIALLLDYMSFLSGAYETEVRNAFERECQQRDLNLLIFFGGSLDETTPAFAARNAVFELVTAGEVDAVVACSTVLAARRGVSAVSRLFERWPGLPACSLGVEVPLVPSVVVDNQAGMAAVVEHMVEVHGSRRMVFITGTEQNPEAQARLLTYQQVLAGHGLPCVPEWIIPGNFVGSLAYQSMLEFLDRGVAFDAVVAASDSMALGAIAALRSRGIRVPRDVPVAGFDDLTVARLGNPPLTTVAQPFQAMAATAVRHVLSQFEGRKPPSSTLLPCEFMVRRSCGCGARPWAAGVPEPSKLDAGSFLLDSRASVTHDIEIALRGAFRARAPEAERLFTGLVTELDGRPGAFLLLIEDLLDDAKGDDDLYEGLENAVAFLRATLAGFATPALEELWHGARDRINLASRANQVRHRIELDNAYVRTLIAAEQLSAAADLSALQQVLSSSLPAIGIVNAILYRHAESEPQTLEPFLWLAAGKRQDLPTTRADSLFPRGSYRYQRRHSTLVFPLTSEAQRFGVSLFEYDATSRGHQMLGEQIGSALRSVWLLREVTQKTILHERSVQERLATATRMQSLSVLAGGVAHDLNNVLGPLVALPDVIRRELEHFTGSEAELAAFRADMDNMGAAASRASQTIKDLLTLSRQGKTHKEPLDLNRVVERHLASESLRFLLEGHPRIRVIPDLDQKPLLIRASESQLTRAIENLVRNAVEAISGDGEVLLRTGLMRLQEPLAGFETIDAGEYAVVIVADTGTGIALADLGRVFEPFFSRKRVRDQSGSGLGLAIVHGVVKEHDGFVDVHSALGTGTTFSLYFPLTAARPRPSDRPSLPPPGRARILIVDDEPIQLRTGRRVLRHLGYDVDTLESGQKARELFERAAPSQISPYDLVILDMILNEPEDGLQVLECIQRLFPGQRAVLASGHAPNERAELAVSKGLTWLVKPYTMDSLARTVRALLPNSDSARAPRRPSEH
jgi:DNA-binding LacI/PurR family transcriptional regulator/signal transduction histidine kinase/ActR/RegA family two-component response regulator